MACIGEPISGELMIRTFVDDTGARPRDPCGEFWSSPDIYFVGDFVSRTSVRVGGEVRVAVRVTNLGGDPIDSVEVEAWICDYTAGHLPRAILNPPSRVTGFRLAPINGGETREIVCDQSWVPTRDQLSINGGHVCIVANAWSSGVDGRQLIGAEIQPCCDCHHGWRNVQILAARAGMRVRQMIRMWGSPHTRKRQDVILEVFANTSKQAFGEGEQDLLKHSIWGRQIELGGVGKPDPKAITVSGKGFEGERRVELTLDPRRSNDVEIEIALPKGARPGTVQVYEAVTRDRNTDEVIGGARVLALTLPDDFKPAKERPKRR